MKNQFIREVTIDWTKIHGDSYLREIDAIRNADTLVFDKPITFFAGENGSGKSTLLEAIAVAYGFNPEGGTKNYSFSTYDSHSELCDAIRISKGVKRPKSGYFLRAESFYNVATKEEEYVDILHPSQKYHEKSHGESFLAIAQNYMAAEGIYIFDEPEAALSPQRQLALLMDIYNCARQGAQFLIVTHSPILLGMPDADIYSFDGGEIHLCNYEETDSYIVTEMFINNRKNLLHRLLHEE
ncbi:MAG: AAA family ATPase [Lachnospiraceae bacterium]|nr:AAA family ATPase [Lachnospiraceae bacterium]